MAPPLVDARIALGAHVRQSIAHRGEDERHLCSLALLNAPQEPGLDVPGVRLGGAVGWGCLMQSSMLCEEVPNERPALVAEQRRLDNGSTHLDAPVEAEQDWHLMRLDIDGEEIDGRETRSPR